MSRRQELLDKAAELWASESREPVTVEIGSIPVVVTAGSLMHRPCVTVSLKGSDLCVLTEGDLSDLFDEIFNTYEPWSKPESDYPWFAGKSFPELDTERCNGCGEDFHPGELIVDTVIRRNGLSWEGNKVGRWAHLCGGCALRYGTNYIGTWHRRSSTQED